MSRLTPSVIFCACAVALCVPVGASADDFTFTPNPNNLSDLDHNYYYTWGISWSLPQNQKITSATLSIDNLNDWTVETGDILYIHLLSNVTTGVHSWYDNEGGGDAFAGQGILLTTYTDNDGWPNPAENWQYTLTPSQISSLTSYSGSKGVFGFGFDPDCHYYNTGVKFKITTGCVPEPASMGLVSLAGMFAFRRRG